MRKAITLILGLISCIILLRAEELEYQFIGSHFLASYYECDSEVLNNKELLLEYLAEAVNQSGATLLKVADYQFDPQGVTIVALLSESHASVHTYPEFKACFVDFFTCGNSCDHTKFDSSFKKALNAGSSNSQYIERN